MELIISNYANGGLEVEALGGRACMYAHVHVHVHTLPARDKIEKNTYTGWNVGRGRRAEEGSNRIYK